MLDINQQVQVIYLRELNNLDNTCYFSQSLTELCVPCRILKLPVLHSESFIAALRAFLIVVCALCYCRAVIQMHVAKVLFDMFAK